MDALPHLGLWRQIAWLVELVGIPRVLVIARTGGARWTRLLSDAVRLQNDGERPSHSATRGSIPLGCSNKFNGLTNIKISRNTKDLRPR